MERKNWDNYNSVINIKNFKKYSISDFTDRGREGEKKRERNIYVKEKQHSFAFHMYPDQGPNLQPRYSP